MILFIILAALTGAGIVATVLVVLRDGYRRIPLRTARTLEP